MNKFFLILSAFLIAGTVHAFQINNGVGSDYELSGGSKQIHDEIVFVKNREGSFLKQLDVVAYVNKDNKHVDVKLATTRDRSAFKAYGVVLNDLLFENRKGKVQKSGIIRNTNTSMWSEGSELFLSETGELTDVEPTTGPKISIGVVIISDSQDGMVLINILKM